MNYIPPSKQENKYIYIYIYIYIYKGIMKTVASLLTLSTQQPKQITSAINCINKNAE